MTCPLRDLCCRFRRLDNRCPLCRERWLPWDIRQSRRLFGIGPCPYRRRGNRRRNTPGPTRTAWRRSPACTSAAGRSSRHHRRPFRPFHPLADTSAAPCSLRSTRTQESTPSGTSLPSGRSRPRPRRPGSRVSRPHTRSPSRRAAPFPSDRKPDTYCRRRGRHHRYNTRFRPCSRLSQSSDTSSRPPRRHTFGRWGSCYRLLRWAYRAGPSRPNTMSCRWSQCPRPCRHRRWASGSTPRRCTRWPCSRRHW
jgi:hypothetical protein